MLKRQLHVLDRDLILLPGSAIAVAGQLAADIGQDGGNRNSERFSLEDYLDKVEGRFKGNG